MAAVLYVIALIVGNSAGSDISDPYLAGSQTVSLGEASVGIGKSRAEAIAEPETRRDALVRDDIYEVRERVNMLQSRLAAIETNTKEITEQIAGLGNSIGPASTAALPAQSAAPAGSTSKTSVTENPEQGYIEKAGGDENGGAQSKPANLGEMAAGIAVRTLPLPETGFGDRSETPPILKVVSRPLAHRIMFGVRLGSGASIDQLRSDWNLVRGRYAAYLSELEGRYQKESSSGGRGAKFQLIAGPFSNVAAAIRLCARLMAGNTNCEPAVFAGKSL